MPAARGAVDGSQRWAVISGTHQSIYNTVVLGYRVPELHSGDPRSDTPVPTPYPAACRPQAWSAAAAVVCLQILREP